MTLFKSRRLAVVTLATALLASAGGALAQSWPDRPLRLVVPLAAGSGADLVARLYAEQLSTALGQPVVVDNKAGASGAIGSEFVARAPADGYTLLLGSVSTHGSNPGMFKKLPYDPVRNFEHVSLLGSFPLIIVSNPALGANSVQDLVAYARANPGKMTFAYGTGSAQVLAELFRKIAGTDVLLVPYKSNPLALNAVIAGESHAMAIDPGAGLPLIAAGRVRGHAVTTAVRSTVVPNLPTMVESGYPEYELYAWNALMAPAGTPAPIVERLSREIRAIVAKPEFRLKLRNAGIDAQSSTPAELRRFVETEIAKWSGHIKAAGMIPE